MPSFQVVQSYTLVPPNAEEAQPGSPSTLACQMPAAPSRVARRAAEDSPPEHAALHIAESLLHVPLIAGFAHQHRHGGSFE